MYLIVEGELASMYLFIAQICYKNAEQFVLWRMLHININLMPE